MDWREYRPELRLDLSETALEEDELEELIEDIKHSNRLERERATIDRLNKKGGGWAGGMAFLPGPNLPKPGYGRFVVMLRVLRRKE